MLGSILYEYCIFDRFFSAQGSYDRFVALENIWENEYFFNKWFLYILLGKMFLVQNLVSIT